MNDQNPQIPPPYPSIAEIPPPGPHRRRVLRAAGISINLEDFSEEERAAPDFPQSWQRPDRPRIPRQRSAPTPNMALLIRGRLAAMAFNPPSEPKNSD